MEPVNFSTSKFCKERKREREGGEIEPRAEKRGVWSRAGERDLSLGIFQELVPIPLGSGQQRRRRQQPPPSAGSDAGRGGRPGGREEAGASGGGGGCSQGPRVRSLFHPGDLCSRPLPHPGLSLLLPPPHPAPTRPSPARAPPPARTRSRSPSRAHTWSARGKVSPAIATRESCGRAPGCNLELSQCGDTFSLLLLPPSFLRPPPRLF